MARFLGSFSVHKGKKTFNTKRLRQLCKIEVQCGVAKLFGYTGHGEILNGEIMLAPEKGAKVPLKDMLQKYIWF